MGTRASHVHQWRKPSERTVEPHKLPMTAHSGAMENLILTIVSYQKGIDKVLGSCQCKLRVCKSASHPIYLQQPLIPAIPLLFKPPS